MSNQFNARMTWHRREVWTIDEATVDEAVAIIGEVFDGLKESGEWKKA